MSTNQLKLKFREFFSVLELNSLLKKLKSKLNTYQVQILSFVLFFISVFWFLSVLSYFFSGTNDQSILESQSDETVGIIQNWMGFIGAWLAHNSIIHGIGFLAIFIPIYFAGFAYSLLNSHFQRFFTKIHRHFLFAMLWLSTFFAFWNITLSFHNNYLGGGIGLVIIDSVKSLIGLFGAFLFLATSGGIYIWLTFFKKVSFLSDKEIFKPKAKKISKTEKKPEKKTENLEENEAEIDKDLIEFEVKKIPNNETTEKKHVEKEEKNENSDEKLEFSVRKVNSAENLTNEIVPASVEEFQSKNQNNNNSTTDYFSENALKDDLILEITNEAEKMSSKKIQEPTQTIEEPISGETTNNSVEISEEIEFSVEDTENKDTEDYESVVENEDEDEDDFEEINAFETLSLNKLSVKPTIKNNAPILSSSNQNHNISAEKPSVQNIETKKTFEENSVEENETLVHQTYDEENNLNFSVVEKQEENLTEEEKAQIEKDFLESLDSKLFDPKLDLSNYKYPTAELLEQYNSSDKPAYTPEELEIKKNRILNTLRNYKIEITSIKATVGPTITLFEIVPAPGIKVSKIKNLEDDIALSLSALGIRIIAPMPGKGTIGIEIPNSNPKMVSFRSVIESRSFKQSTAALPIAMGKTISNDIFLADLTKMPHLLIAGATGQGKSVGLNTIIASILYKKHPAEVKFVLIDPKKVEMTLYQIIEKHFLAKLPDMEDATITDTQQVVRVLNSLTVEMDERYDLLKKARVRNLKDYNKKFKERKLNPKKGHRYLPYIVLVIDELADLMMTAGKEVEAPIARLAQLARAIGIHLVVATQRPSVNVITGMIKANFPARMSYRVISKIDSRTILDSNGADQLIGRGDMLFSTGTDLIRVQNAFIDTPEVEKLVHFIADQQAYPSAYLLPEVKNEDDDDESEFFSFDERDKLFEEAAKLVVVHQQGSTSLIQRRLKVGYNRAGRIIDQLEQAGIVGPFVGSKARDVLIADEIELEQYLSELV